MCIPNDLFNDNTDTKLAKKLLRKMENKRVFCNIRRVTKSTVCGWAPDNDNDIRYVLNHMARDDRVPVKETSSGEVCVTGYKNSVQFTQYDQTAN